MSGRRLPILVAKKEVLFQRVQRLYDNARNINKDKNKEFFSTRYKSLESAVAEFKSVVEEISLLEYEIDPTKEINLQLLTTLDDMYCYILGVADTLQKSEEIKRSSPQNAADYNSNSAARMETKIKLPHLELPTFTGEIGEWPFFSHAFKLIHENSNLSKSEKLRYLLGKLSNKALALVSGFQPSEENYDLIWKTLSDKYEDKRNL